LCDLLPILFHWILLMPKISGKLGRDAVRLYALPDFAT
jgi:hypothetical protein